VNSATRIARRWSAILLFPVLLIACNRAEQVQVTGKVSFDGGPMPGPGTLFFTPIEPAGKDPQYPGTAEFGPDGNYAASMLVGDGLAPGTYGVGVHCWKAGASSEELIDSDSFIPTRYLDAQTSGLRLVVKPGAKSMTKDFDLSGRR
jgi:hypothetical protein